MEAIRYYVQGAFRGVEATPEVLEQQEELIADLTAKVKDLVAEGKSQEEALGMAISSVGDLSALVSEFESAAAVPAAPTVASVYATRLDLHVTAISFAVGAAVMIAGAAVGAALRLIEGSVALSILAVLALGLWWVSRAYVRYTHSPEEVEVRSLVHKERFLKALLVWVGLFVVTGAWNVLWAPYSGFWAWPFWVAGGTWALAAKVEQRLMGQPTFLTPESPESEPGSE